MSQWKLPVSSPVHFRDRAAWEKVGIGLPGYDVEAASEKAKKDPVWVHFGIGNIFRIFIGGIADGLLESGAMDRGITCVGTFDYDVVDQIYDPYDNLGLSVILHGDGTREYRVLGSMAEAVKAQWNRLKEIFSSPSLQMVSFTITEKGYALHKSIVYYNLRRLTAEFIDYIRLTLNRLRKLFSGSS